MLRYPDRLDNLTSDTHRLPALADIVRGQTCACTHEPSIPLRRILSNNRARLPVRDAQGFGSIQLVADKRRVGFQILTEGTEEALARLVRERQTRVGADDQRVRPRVVHLVDDLVAVGVDLALIEPW